MTVFPASIVVTLEVNVTGTIVKVAIAGAEFVVPFEAVPVNVVVCVGALVSWKGPCNGRA